jgi:hypothetical protein
LSNESEDDHIGTASNENETGLIDNGGASIEMQDANKTEGTKEQETVLNENVEINQNTSNGNEMKDQHESEITNDDNDATPSLNDKEQSENSNEILSKSNEEMSYPTSEGEIIRQHKFYIHSSWLAVQSSYFRSLFFSGMNESSATEVHIQISESEEQAHLMLLEAMYKIDTLDNASVDELLEVLKIAHKYDVKFVFKKAKYCLQVAVVSIDICEKITCFIKVDNMITDVDDLASTLQSFLANEFSPLDKTWHTTSFKELCEPSVWYLLSSDKLVADSENTIFHALMHWVEHRGIENVFESEGMPSILSVIRFELMSIDYLYNIVQYNSVAKKLPAFNDHYLRGISYHAVSNTMKRRLLCQPVKREASTESFIPYTWVIPRDELDKLVATDKEFKSDTFWYCGYQMFLVINDVDKVGKSKGNKVAVFNATLSLEIINLTQQSDVMIQWQPTSQSFTSTLAEQTHTFDKKPCMSSVDIKYKMEVEQEKSSSNEASGHSPMSNSGFNLFSSVTAAPRTAPIFSVLATPSKTTPTGFFSGVATPSKTTTTGFFSGVAAAPRTTAPLYCLPATPKTTSTEFFSATTTRTSTSSFLFSGVASPSTNTLRASKPDSIPYLSIDVKMKLV